MGYIVQVDFKMTGPFGQQMAEEFTELAQSINEEAGFVWKIWTENTDNREAGGIYLFASKTDAETYLNKHTKRLKNFGITNIRGKIFEINERLSLINHAPIHL